MKLILTPGEYHIKDALAIETIQRISLRPRLHCTVFIRRRYTNVPFWPTVYTVPFSYEDGTQMFSFGLPSTLYRFHTKTVHKFSVLAYRLHYTVFIRRRYTNVPFWPTIYTIPFSYEDGTQMFRFGLPSTLYRFHTKTVHKCSVLAYRLHYTVFIRRRYTNVPFWPTVYTVPFSYEDGTQMFRFGLPSTLYRFPI